MKKIYCIVLMGLVVAGAFQSLAQAPPPAMPKPQVPAVTKTVSKPAVAKPQVAKLVGGVTLLTTPKEKVSYSLGLDLGQNFKNQGFDIDVKLMARGIEDAWQGSKPLLSEKEIAETMEAFRQQYVSKQQARLQILAEKNEKDGEQFLTENKARPGIVTLPSGLQYKEIVAGTGATPKLSDTVTAHYRGTLIDGSEFDSSYKRGEPVTMEVSKVIPGWTEALQLMKVGAKWQLFVPAILAYGRRSPGPEIPPNSTLIFEIELLSIK